MGWPSSVTKNSINSSSKASEGPVISKILSASITVKLNEKKSRIKMIIKKKRFLVTKSIPPSIHFINPSF